MPASEWVPQTQNLKILSLGVLFHPPEEHELRIHRLAESLEDTAALNNILERRNAKIPEDSRSSQTCELRKNPENLQLSQICDFAKLTAF